jgi:hypothetical protein
MLFLLFARELARFFHDTASHHHINFDGDDGGHENDCVRRE